jgi:protein ImuB
MRFWLSVHLPSLPLECIRPRWCEPGSYVVVDKDRVIAVSESAQQAGVQQNMRPGSVAAISPSTVIIERDEAREQTLLHAVAMALLQYTPEVAYAAEFSVVLDVTASLTLFGGRLAICRRVRDSLRLLGVSAQLGTGPTAMGAWLLGRRSALHVRRPRRRTVTLPSLSRQLDGLPASCLPAALPFREWLAGIGADHLGALRRLPRQGILRRMSTQVLVELDRAYGQACEMLAWVKIPDTFSARVETFDRIEHADALLIGATSLIAQMVGWLVSTQQAVSIFVLLLEHERGRTAMAPTLIEIALAEPTWRDEHLVRLLKERLGRVELTAPVIALTLKAELLTAMAPPTAQLFPEPGGNPGDFERLMELLGARLGDENILTPLETHDHRPEVSNAWIPISTKRGRPIGEDDVQEQPFWLLPKPIPLLIRGDRPFYHSPLKMIKGPERREAGWWDDQLAVRDYYVAQAADATCYWIYLERVVDGRWYLHGMFA